MKDVLKVRATELLREKEYELALHLKTLEKSDIRSILNKGFAYIEKNGKSVAFKDLSIGDVFETIVKDGKIAGKILNLEEM